MRTGEHKHFISRTAQPVVSVSYFSSGDQNQYKILYNGSGGGVMMSIISIIRSTNKVTLNSFVTIGVTNLVDNCGEYDNQLVCIKCVFGWHLEGGRCYSNIQDCNSYYGQICLECFGYSVLIENRCVGCA